LFAFSNSSVLFDDRHLFSIVFSMGMLSMDRNSKHVLNKEVQYMYKWMKWNNLYSNTFCLWYWCYFSYVMPNIILIVFIYFSLISFSVFINECGKFILPCFWMLNGCNVNCMCTPFSGSQNTLVINIKYTIIITLIRN
jgi:hypothetical protein